MRSFILGVVVWLLHINPCFALSIVHVSIDTTPLVNFPEFAPFSLALSVGTLIDTTTVFTLTNFEGTPYGPPDLSYGGQGSLSDKVTLSDALGSPTWLQGFIPSATDPIRFDIKVQPGDEAAELTMGLFGATVTGDPPKINGIGLVLDGEGELFTLAVEVEVNNGPCTATVCAGVARVPLVSLQTPGVPDIMLPTPVVSVVVPEPQTGVLLVTGLVALALWPWRQKQGEL